MFRSAWLLGAWMSFLAILGLLYIRDEIGFERRVASLASGDYGKYGQGIVLVGILIIALPPFLSAGMLLIGCFEIATGCSFRQIESWFGELSWPRKCLVAPILAAPLAILSYGLIWFGAIVVRNYMRR